jgi:hypothetical protein
MIVKENSSSPLRAETAGAPGQPKAPKFEKTYCSQCGGSFGPGDGGFSHCSDHWSPGVRKAMAVFEASLAKRYADEFGLPWNVEPWGDGSKPPYVNICSESHCAVVAADLERETANFIVALANAKGTAPRDEEALLNERAREDCRRIYEMSCEWADASKIAPQPGDGMLVQRVRGLLWLYHRADARACKAERMEAALHECLSYLEDREDVVDGPYGQPAPNAAMSLASEVRAALSTERLSAQKEPT